MSEENMPKTLLSDENFKDEKIGILTLLVLCGLCESNSRARTLVSQGGISLNNKKITSTTLEIKKEEFKEGIKIKKGKKIFHLAKLK